MKGNKKKAETFLIELCKQYDTNNITITGNITSTSLFSDFMKSWLNIVRSQVVASTYVGYARVVENSIIPYFEEKGILLIELSASDIQDYYQYLLSERKVSANTVLHHHANIHKALKYALKVGVIPFNPSDRVERPQKEEFTGAFYSASELQALFEIVEGTPMEYPVIMAAFYGLRRNEIVGLRWDSIDFQQKTITIENTVDVLPVNGKTQLVAKSRSKNASSRRTLPLVPKIESLLLKMKQTQKDYQLLCKSSYH